MNQSKIVSLDDYRQKRKEEETTPLLAFHVDRFYSYPEFGLKVQILGITDKSIYFQRHPIYVLQDQTGQVYVLPLDEKSCIGWEEITYEEFIESISYPDDFPPNIS